MHPVIRGYVEAEIDIPYYIIGEPYNEEKKMATIKIKMRMSARDKGMGTLYYQVIQRRVVKLIHSGYTLCLAEWDAVREAILVLDGTDDKRREYLLKVEEALHIGRLRLESIVKIMEHSSSKTYTAEDVVRIYRMADKERGFIAFGRKLVIQFDGIDKRALSERYNYVLNRFAQFRQDKDLPLEEVSSRVMIEFENYLKAGNVCINTSSYYMRNLRAVYKRAVEKGLVEDANPFRHVYTGIDKTRKRAIPMATVRRIKELDLTLRPLLDYARDLFLFSVYMRGMSFVDMAYLKKTDLRNGFITYRRQKTDRQLTVKWEDMMQEIVDKYDTGGTPYMLPVIKDMEADRRRQYKSALRLVNNKLKVIGEMVGLTVPLTTYVARHAWASIAKERHVSVSVISEAMGHDSEKTTRIYLATLDTTEIDMANRHILDALR